MISVLVPSRTDEYLQQCLQAMEQSEAGSTARVIVGDNGISDILKQRWKQVRFVPVKQPFVFAQAINICAKEAEPESDLIVLNDDTMVETPYWLTMIERLLAEPVMQEYGIVSLQINGGVGNQDQNVRGLGPTDVVETLKTVCFVCAVIPRRIWMEIGPLDERFTGYGFDDDDYCKRIRDVKLKCGVTGAATVKHGAGGYPHSSSYAKLLGQAEWQRKYELNGRIFQAKWGMSVMQNRECLNVGCGDHPKENEGLDRWLNLDIRPLPGVDIVRDLRRGLPFSDGTFDHVLCDNVLEHFVSEDVIFIINEIDRVLKVGGTAEIIVPHAHSQGAIQDPTHKSLFVPRSAIYWNQEASKYGGLAVGITANLIPTEIDTFGDEKSEFFIRFRLIKKPIKQIAEEVAR